MQNDTVKIPFKILMKSHFSSAFGISALLLFLFSMKDIFKQKSGTRAPRLELQAPPSSSLIKPFLKGLLVSSTFLCFYILFQQIWGMDFLGRSVPEARHMAGGLYRVSGLFSHPLTLAGVGLCFFGFTGALLVQKEFMSKKGQLFLTLLMSAYFVFASGGRIASVLVVFFGLMLLAFNYLAPGKKRVRFSPKNLLMKFVLFAIGLTVCALVLQQIGVFSRFSNLFTISNNREFERLTFWQVHWKMFLDQPWLGQGLALLNTFKRNEYYELLGFATLENKYPAHNMLLEILSNVGIVGLGFIVFGVFEVWKSIRTVTHGNQIYVRSLLFAFVLNFINGFTQNVFFDSSVMYIYLSLVMLILWGDLNDSLKESPRRYNPKNREGIAATISDNK
jgi:O-antigen ligase